MDAMQDVFVEVLRRHDTLEASAPAGLFMRVATNVCLNRLRTVRRRKEDPTDGLLMDIAAAVPDREDQSAARRALDRIFGARTDSTFEIAVLHYVDRMTLEEVAHEVGLSVSGVRKRLRTLRERLPVEEGAAS